MLNDKSTAQTKVQTQIVEQLEQQLYKVGIQTNGLSTFMMYFECSHECTLRCLTNKLIIMSHLGLCLYLRGLSCQFRI